MLLHVLGGRGLALCMHCTACKQQSGLLRKVTYKHAKVGSPCVCVCNDLN